MSSDAAAIERLLVEWMTEQDIVDTMRRRDRSWLPMRTRAAMAELLKADRLEITGMPRRFRTRRVTPGEVTPRRGPGLDA